MHSCLSHIRHFAHTAQHRRRMHRNLHTSCIYMYHKTYIIYLNICIYIWSYMKYKSHVYHIYVIWHIQHSNGDECTAIYTQYTYIYITIHVTYISYIYIYVYIYIYICMMYIPVGGLHSVIIKKNHSQEPGARGNGNPWIIPTCIHIYI